MGFSRVVRVDVTGSTNTDVMRGLTEDPGLWPHLAVLVAGTQTQGRGRSGRNWVTPADGSALTCSVVIRPQAGSGELPPHWVPLLVGLAVRRALEPWLAAGLKWPNDVVAGGPPDPHPEWGWGLKLGGVLSELHPSGAIVAGIGLNCGGLPAQMPVPWAGSIEVVSGREVRPEEVLDALGEALPDVLAEWDSNPDRIRAEYAQACVAIGQQVRAVLPGGAEVTGTAVGVSPDGELVVSQEGRLVALSVGDVLRVR